MQEFFMKKPFFLAALTAIAIFTACSESSSSNSPVDPAPIGTDPSQGNPQQPDPDQPVVTPSDSATTNPAIITDPVINPETGDTTTTVVNPPADTTLPQPTDTTTTQPTMSSGCAEGEVPVPVTYPQDEFIDVGDVYRATQCNEKVVFFIRHGQREASIERESQLTEDGALEAQAMGAKLIGPEKFAYVHSGFVRTYQTVLNVALGRGEAQMLPDSTVLNFQADTIPQLADGWYMKDKERRDFYVQRDSIRNINVMYTKWVYDGEYSDVFYDLAERSEELIHTFLVKDYAEMPKFTVVASHDQVIVPLAAYATDKKIDIILHRTYNWLEYLAGVGIIINDKNEIRFVAVKGGETGTR